MIVSFQHKGIEKYFKTESKAGIQPAHAAKLKEQLAVLNRALKPSDMNLPSWRFHQLEKKRLRYSVRVDKSWRLTFEFEGRDAVLVDYEDYH